MITLSKRMHAIADMVSEGGIVADVGCDHGYVSIYLLESGKKDGAIAMDVRTGPLNSARENVRMAGLTERIELRLSDGLEKLGVKEADTIIIAGMGGLLMEEILTKGKKTAFSCGELILQPQSELYRFRRYLMEQGYLFLEEKCVFDEGKYYFPMRVCPFDSPLSEAGYKLEKEVEFKYGGYTLQQKDETLKAFLLKEQAQWSGTLEHLQTAPSNEDLIHRIQEVEAHLALIDEALLYYSMGR